MLPLRRKFRASSRPGGSFVVVVVVVVLLGTFEKTVECESDISPSIYHTLTQTDRHTYIHKYIHAVHMCSPQWKKALR